MKLSEFMAAAKQYSATGERTGRQMVLALDCSEDGSAEVKDYAVIANHVENVGASLSGKTVDKEYIGEGASTIKSSTQRSFDVTGQLLRGDEFHDFVCSHAIKYGVGSAVQRKYVYFDPGTMKGETGTATIVVNKDGAGAAGDPGDIDVSLSVAGTPEEYTYSDASQASAQTDTQTTEE